MPNPPSVNYGKNKFFVLGLSVLLPLLLVAFFMVEKNCQADEKDLVISEIMYYSAGHSDWIELYNNGSKKVSLAKKNFGIIDEKNLEMGSDGVHYKNCHRIDGDLELSPGEFAIIASSKDDFKRDYPDVKAAVLDSAFSLSANGDYIRLSNDRCATFFADMHYESSWGGKNNGKTLEKIDFAKGNAKSNWQESYVDGGTPGEKSSQKPNPQDFDFNVFINEIFPAPDKNAPKYNAEYIELFNAEKKDVDLSGWILKDTSKTGKYVFPQDTQIKSRDYLAIYKKDYKFALNNSGDESVILINPAGMEVSRLDYTGSQKSFSYSFDGKTWRWTSQPTPDAPNVFDKMLAGKIKKDDLIYANIYANFSVKADQNVQKFTWDFGDGHKSYLKSTRHKYTKAGTYQGSLRLRGTGEEQTYTFKVKVEKYKAPKVKIIRLSPNPVGRDTDNEWLEIKNESKKTVNLQDWSIATGWDKLVNHPVRKDFKIKAGQTKKLTRGECAFTLANTRDKIELRDPAGQTVQKIKYDREKIGEGDVYEKPNGRGWQWIMAPNNKNKLITNPPLPSGEDVSRSETGEGTTIINQIPDLDPALIGHFSPNPAWRDRQTYRAKLASYLTHIQLPVAASGQVLGVSAAKTNIGTSRDSSLQSDENYYFFTAPNYQKHWALVLIENLWLKINSRINRLLAIT